MKQPQQKNRTKKDVPSEGSHAVGLKENPYVKRQALKALPSAKEVEKARKEAGWVWIRKDKTMKQVHPDKLEKYLEEDWTPAN